MATMAGAAWELWEMNTFFLIPGDEHLCRGEKGMDIKQNRQVPGWVVFVINGNMDNCHPTPQDGMESALLGTMRRSMKFMNLAS